jgi:hypothetical protein
VSNVKKFRGLNLPGTPLGPCGLLWALPLPLHTYTQKYSIYIRAGNYKYYQDVVAKTGHPAVMYVYYELVLAATNATGIFSSVIENVIFFIS